MSKQDGMALDGDAFLRELEEIREAILGDRPLRDRPRLASKEAIAAARRERHRGGSTTVNRNVERYLGVPDIEVRRKQLRELIDEAGEDLFGGETPAHSTLDRSVSKAFDVTDEELDRLGKEDPLPELIMRTGWWISMHREGPWPFGIGSALVGEGEKLNPKRAALRLEELERNRKDYAAMGVDGHIVQVNDVVEETLPFRGRIRFDGLEGEGSALIGRVESVVQDYKGLLADHHRGLTDLARAAGWTFSTHVTDQPPQLALLGLYTAVSAPQDI